MHVTAEYRNTWGRTVRVPLCAPPVCWTDWGTNPGPRVERLANKRLSHTAAFITKITSTTSIHGAYNYIPETKHVQTVHNVAAMLQSQFMLHVMPIPILHVLYLFINTFPSLCAAPIVALFCSSLISCFPVSCSGILWMTEIVPVAPVIAGTTLFPHSPCSVFLL